jgi:hypothetical protein
MATTTNYGWTTPDDSSLVKDGASAIRTLGSSVDTTVKALSPGTTAGDVDYYTSSTAKARLAIGTTGQVLTVAGGVPSWATSSSGGMTLLSTTSLSGTSTTVSSISGSYTDLMVIVEGVTMGSAKLQIQANGSATDSWSGGYDIYPNQVYNSGAGQVTDTSWTATSSVLIIYQYAGTTYKKNGAYNTTLTGLANNGFAVGSYGYNSTSAISSIKITNNAATTFTAGQVKIYGVK